MKATILKHAIGWTVLSFVACSPAWADGPDFNSFSCGKFLSFFEFVSKKKPATSGLVMGWMYGYWSAQNQNKVLDFDEIERILEKVFASCRTQPNRLALDVLLEQRP